MPCWLSSVRARERATGGCLSPTCSAGSAAVWVGITNDLGLDKDDDAALRAALEDQGVTDIKKVELAF